LKAELLEGDVEYANKYKLLIFLIEISFHPVMISCKDPCRWWQMQHARLVPFRSYLGSLALHFKMS